MRSNEACASGDEGALLMCHLVRITTANAEVAKDAKVRKGKLKRVHDARYAVLKMNGVEVD
jgi:hypothetical protein